MRKIFFSIIFVFCLLSKAKGQSHFRNSPAYLKRNIKNQLLRTTSSGFGVWENNYGAIGAGANVEFGGAYPLLNLNRRFFFLLDGYGRLSSIKRMAFGIGGTTAAEIRFYNAPQPIARYGIEVSWGLNVMLYSFGEDDGLHLLYGGNWMRMGFIDAASLGKRTDLQYFAQFQYWRGSWYSSVGIEMDVFSKNKRMIRTKF